MDILPLKTTRNAAVALYTHNTDYSMLVSSHVRDLLCDALVHQHVKEKIRRESHGSFEGQSREGLTVTAIIVIITGHRSQSKQQETEASQRENPD